MSLEMSFYSNIFNLNRTGRKGNPKSKMMQQFIFKTVPAGHKTRLQSAEHTRAKRGVVVAPDVHGNRSSAQLQYGT